ncbi:MAG: Xylose isomerase-like barrel [Paenibacillus sp.]|jgi:sugar phosphate isomerase/epimerase|nr:Xylose isomerase-like barrel [Paenibacillus sp.]
MKLGFSLSPRLLLGEPGDVAERRLLDRFGSPERLLAYLKESGIESIELRYVTRQEKRDCEPLFRRIWEQGLELTIHSRIEGTADGERLADHFPSLGYALEHYRDYQDGLVLALHAYAVPSDRPESIGQLADDTVRQLRQWIRMVQDESHHIRFAVELTRKVSGKTDPGAAIDTLLPIVGQLDETYCGLCWDMGHYYSNLLKRLQFANRPAHIEKELPGKAFVSRVIHTHIHGLGSSGKTHFPLVPEESLPLELYIRALRQEGYAGVCNLELECQRYADEPELFEQIDATIGRLRACADGGGVPG